MPVIFGNLVFLYKLLITLIQESSSNGTIINMFECPHPISCFLDQYSFPHTSNLFMTQELFLTWSEFSLFGTSSCLLSSEGFSINKHVWNSLSLCALHLQIIRWYQGTQVSSQRPQSTVHCSYIGVGRWLTQKHQKYCNMKRPFHLSAKVHWCIIQTPHTEKLLVNKNTLFIIPFFPCLPTPFWLLLF